jgi:hypothetical protein
LEAFERQNAQALSQSGKRSVHFADDDAKSGPTNATAAKKRELLKR